MKRIILPIALLFSALAAVPAQSAIDQASWNARKQSVRLANGIRLSYVELGDPAGSPVLLLHGWTDNSRVWTILAPELMKHRLLIPDQRGHGASDAPSCCYALADFAYDATLFLDAKGVEKASLVGHSLGSMVAQAIASSDPGRVDKLMLLGSTGLPPIKRGDWLWENVTRLSYPLDVNGAFMREWGPAASPTPVDSTYVAFSNPEIASVPRQVWQGVLRDLVDHPTHRYGPDIRASTMILSGGKDSLFPPEHHDALVKAIPHAKAHVFPGLGHNFVLEQPEVVAPMLRDFLAD